MKKKWVITIIVPILFGITYYATYEIAKKSYYDSVQEKINGVVAERFFKMKQVPVTAFHPCVPRNHCKDL